MQSSPNPGFPIDKGDHAVDISVILCLINIYIKINMINSNSIYL